MSRLTARQRQGNLQCAGHWLLAAEHRHRVMQLIESCAPAFGGRVCVLGAGNCNDLDLRTLLDCFAEVALIDLDGDALRQAVARQNVAGDAGLQLYGNCDLTSVWTELEKISADPPNADLLDRAIAQAPQPAFSSLGERFDVVLSTCVISQIVKGAVDTLGERHPKFLELLSALRIGHLRLLADLTAPGGSLMLVTDFVSSDTAPEIATAPVDELAALAQRLLERRNFFHGLNPAVLADLWRRDEYLSSRTAALRVPTPWRWNFGVRHYLVTAFCLEKRRRSPTQPA